MKKLLFSYFEKIWHDAADLNNKILKSCIEPEKKAKVLDIGFYRGELSVERFKNIKHPDIYGIDISQEAIKSGKKINIKTVKHNLEKGLPYKSNFFDIIAANQIIEHLVDVDLFMKEIYRVLKPKGYLILSTENLSSWHNLFALTLGWQAFSQHISRKSHIGNPLRLHKIGREDEDIHIKIFTLRGLKDLFSIYNFKVETTFGAGYYPIPYPFAKILSKIDPIHAAFIGLKARKPTK